MRIVIMCDLEGISGVVSGERQAKPGSPGYQEARTFLMSDLNAAIEGAVEAGVEQVLVCDSHYFGENILLGSLHPSAVAVFGRACRLPIGQDDHSFVGTFLVGYHAMGGTECALLNHTYGLPSAEVTLNGVRVGEIGMEAAIAAELGMPVLLVTADSAGAQEAQALLGGVEVAVVKQSLSTSAALCYPLPVSRETIRQAAYRAVKNRENVRPLDARPPYEIRISYSEQAQAARASEFGGARLVAPNAVIIVGECLQELWRAFDAGIYPPHL